MTYSRYRVNMGIVTQSRRLVKPVVGYGGDQLPRAGSGGGHTDRAPRRAFLLHTNECNTGDGRATATRSGRAVGRGRRGRAKPSPALACQYKNKAPFHTKRHANLIAVQSQAIRTQGVTGGDSVAGGKWGGVRGGETGAGFLPPAVSLDPNIYHPFSSVAHCARQDWAIMWWDRKHPKKKMKRRFVCNMWRHEGACRQWKGSQDHVRISGAFGGRSHLVYIVLTFDPMRYKNEWSAYRAGYHNWDRMRKMLERQYGKVDYVQVWERHQSGWPHVNIVIDNEEIYRQCEGEGWKTWRQTLKKCAKRYGFGEIAWVEPLENKAAMAGYLVKLAGELTKDSQIPCNAPPHFRRLRASRGFLPRTFAQERRDEHRFTGLLVTHPVNSFVAYKYVSKEEILENRKKNRCDVAAISEPVGWGMLITLPDLSDTEDVYEEDWEGEVLCGYLLNVRSEDENNSS